MNTEDEEDNLNKESDKDSIKNSNQELNKNKNEDTHSCLKNSDSNPTHNNQYINVNKLESQTNPQITKPIIIEDFDQVEDTDQEFKFTDLEENETKRQGDDLTSSLNEMQTTINSDEKKLEEEKFEEPI